MKATRRAVLAGAAAVPAVAGLPQASRAQPGAAVLVHDASLEAGRRVALLHEGEILAIEGDRIRFARALFERRPSLVVGISRPADVLLIEEVGHEAGYALTTGPETFRHIINRSRDRGMVLGWALSPRT